MHNQHNFKGVTQNNGNAGVAAGTTGTITTTAATNASIKGFYGTPLAAGANQTAPVVDSNFGTAFRPVAPSQVTVVVIGVNLAGQLRMLQGSIEPAGVAPQFPMVPDEICPLAYAVVSTGANSAAWTPGTSAWAATGVTATFRNVSTLPDRPALS